VLRRRCRVPEPVDENRKRSEVADMGKSTEPPNNPPRLSVRGFEQECSHCYGTGWVVMGAESDFGEYEEYYVLCRRCAEIREDRRMA
jgi:hypothetical protein